MFDAAGTGPRDADLLRRSSSPIAHAHALQDLLSERAIHVISAELTIATGGADLKDTVVQDEDGYIERASTEVVDGKGAVLLAVEAVRERSCCGLIQQAQDGQ